MTSTFASALDLIAWCLKGEGLNYAVSSDDKAQDSDNSREYVLTKIQNKDFTRNEIVTVKICLEDVNFPLTISKSVCEILSLEYILPLIKDCIDGKCPACNCTFNLRKALDEAKNKFYKNKNTNNTRSELGGTGNLGKVPTVGEMGNRVMSNAFENRINDTNDTNYTNYTSYTNNTNNTTSAGDFKPGYEDEYQLQQHNRNDLNFNKPLQGRLTNPSTTFGDFDLYPNGERIGHFGDPMAMGGMGGMGGMHPTFDDPLFQQQQVQNQGRRQRGPNRGANIRYDDPTGGNTGPFGGYGGYGGFI